MKRIRSGVCIALCLCLVVLGGGAAFAKGAEEGAILVVAFGTSVERARAAYAKVEERIKEAFPGRDVRWAWTAHSLLKTGPSPMLSTQEALAKLGAEGVKEVSILSLHIIPGKEYSDLLRNAQAFEGLPKGLRRVTVSPPLLYDTESLRAVADLLIQSAPKERKAEDAMLFVGHGTHHPAGVYYPALQYYLSALDKNAFVGTVEGEPDLENVTAALKAGGIKRVWLAPLMTVAGDHALNDLFGDEPDSWKQHFITNGIRVETVARGLGEDAGMIDHWLKGLRKSME